MLLTSSKALLLLIIYIIFPVVLQIIICKKAKGKGGLVLPIISFLISLFYLLQIADTGDNVIPVFLYTLIIANIPTVILYTIYRVYRNKNKNNDEIEKMKLKDF